MASQPDSVPGREEDKTEEEVVVVGETGRHPQMQRERQADRYPALQFDFHGFLCLGFPGLTHSHLHPLPIHTH